MWLFWKIRIPGPFPESYQGGPRRTQDLCRAAPSPWATLGEMLTQGLSRCALSWLLKDQNVPARRLGCRVAGGQLRESQVPGTPVGGGPLTGADRVLLLTGSGVGSRRRGAGVTAAGRPRKTRDRGIACLPPTQEVGRDPDPGHHQDRRRSQGRLHRIQTPEAGPTACWADPCAAHGALNCCPLALPLQARSKMSRGPL